MATTEKTQSPPTETMLERVRELLPQVSDEWIANFGGTDKILKLLNTQGGTGLLINHLKKEVNGE